MAYLVLSILVSVGIFLVFKIAGGKGLRALPFVCVNYFVAIIIGSFSVIKGEEVILPKHPVFYLSAVIIGILFMLMFLLVHRSTIVSGISITSAATKLSVIFPVVASVIIDSNDILYIQKLIGVFILMASFLLIVFKPNMRSKPARFIIIPVILFVGMGFVDSVVKISQQFFIPIASVELFTLLVFFVASLTGFVVIVYDRSVSKLFKVENLVYGLFLGLFNYGSLFFLIKALNLNIVEPTFLDSSRIFMINNLGIIIISTLIGVVFFKEKLKVLNYFGILLSVIGFYLIM